MASAESDAFGLKDRLRLFATVGWLVLLIIWPRMTVATTLLIIGGVFVAFNAMLFWLAVVKKEFAPAVAPIIGGMVAAAGVACLPIEESWTWAWIPLLIDWGGLPNAVQLFFRQDRSETPPALSRVRVAAFIPL